MGIEQIVSSATKKILSPANARKQRITGSVAQIVVLPVGTNLELGVEYVIINSSTATVTVRDSSETVSMNVLASEVQRFTLVDKTANLWVMG